MIGALISVIGTERWYRNYSMLLEKKSLLKSLKSIFLNNGEIA